MFSLDNTMRYWLYSKPVNMRMGFNGLSGIVNNHMGMDIRSGDVFVFVNSARNRMKILHREESGLVLYALRIEMGRMRLTFIGCLLWNKEEALPFPGMQGFFFTFSYYDPK